MKKQNSIISILPVLFGFFVMGFCDIVGISSDYAREAFGWSPTMAGFVPSMVFVWFLFFSIPVGIKMNAWGRKNTVMLSMAVTLVGMFIPLLKTDWACLMGYALLGIGNTILQVSLNPLLNNVVTDQKLLTSSLTAGQVVKAVSSFCGPFIMLFAVNVLGQGDKANWYLAFPVLGAITLISAVWLYATPIPHEEVEATDVTTGKVLGLLSDSVIFRLFLGIFFVVGIDVATNFVSSKVMIYRFDWDVQEAGIAPQIYFICRTVGAFLGVFFMTKISEMKYFRINIIAAAAVILLLIFYKDTYVNLVCIGGIGFFCSCIFSIIYSMAIQHAPDKANLISGLMITAVAGGGFVTPFIGNAIDMAGISAGITVLLACAAYLMYCAYAVKVERK